MILETNMKVKLTDETLRNSFISDEIKIREYTESMIKAQTIKYSVIG